MNASSEDTKNANIISSSTTAAVTEVDGVIVPASDREITSSNLASNIRNHPTEDTGNAMTECQNDNGSGDEDEDDVSTILSESLFHSCISTATASSFFGDAPTDDNWKPGDNSSTGVDFTRNREKIEEPSRSRAREFLSEIQSEAVSRAGHSHGASISNDDETGEESVAPKSLWAKDDAEEHDTASRATIKERTTPSKSEAKTKGEDDAARPYNAATTEWESTAPSSTSNTVSHITVVNNSHGSNSNSNSTNTTNSSWNDISKTQPQLLHNLQRERPVVRSLTFNRDRTCLILSTSMGVRIRTLESLSLSLNGLGGQTDQENDCRQNQQQQQQHSVASEGRDQNVARTSGKTGTSHDNNIVNDVSAHSYLHDIPLPPDGSSYAQLLHDTSLIAVVRPSTPRCLYLYNAKGNASYARNLNRSPLAAMPLSAAIKRVELTRNVLVALTVDGRLHVFHMGRSASDSSGANDGSPSSSTGPTVKAPVLKPTWIQTINILHSSDSLRNFSRGLEASYAGSYFDLSPNEKYPYLVCKSFNGTAGTIRVYDPTVVHEVDTSTGSGGNSLSGRSTSNRSLSSGGGISAASSWDFHYTHGNSVTSPSTGRKLKKRIQLHTTINAHEHPVTRMLIGGGGSVASTSTTTATQPQTYLATTSSNGTTIRVFALPTGQQLWEWHRGSRACQFHTLSWNGNADKLVSYGSSGTIHVFDWQHRDALSGRNSNINSADHSGEGEDGGEATFFRVADEGTASNRDTATLSETSNKKSNDASRPLIKRIGSKLRRQAAKNINSNNPTKHRSFAKLRIQTLLSTPSTIPPSNDANKNNDSNNKATTLVVALLDRRNPDISVDHGVTATSAEMDAVDTKEDSLVICNLEGELRQYSVNSAGSFRLTQMEDVLFRDANLFPVRGDRR